MENIGDLYTDFLLSSFGRTTATGLASLLEGAKAELLSGQVARKHPRKHRPTTFTIPYWPM